MLPHCAPIIGCNHHHHHAVWMMLPCKPLRRDMITVVSVKTAAVIYGSLQTFQYNNRRSRATRPRHHLSKMDLDLTSCRKTQTDVQFILYCFILLFNFILRHFIASVFEMWYIDKMLSADPWHLLQGSLAQWVPQVTLEPPQGLLECPKAALRPISDCPNIFEDHLPK